MRTQFNGTYFRNHYMAFTTAGDSNMNKNIRENRFAYILFIRMHVN